MTLAGCQLSENRFLARAVRSDELIGSWRATEFAIKSLRDVGVRDHLTVEEHTLVLRADGSCRIQTVINMPVFEPADYRTYDSGCRWRLGEIGHQALQFDLKPAPSKRCERRSPLSGVPFPASTTECRTLCFEMRQFIAIVALATAFSISGCARFLCIACDGYLGATGLVYEWVDAPSGAKSLAFVDTATLGDHRVSPLVGAEITLEPWTPSSRRPAGDATTARKANLHG